MKKMFCKMILVLVMSFLSLCPVNFAYAEDSHNISDESKVSRRECIMSIMQSLEVDEDSADIYKYSDYYIPVFADLGNDVYEGYIIIAKFADVAAGISRYDGDTVRCFEPKRNVTVKECLTFMMRCLEEPTSIKWDEDVIDFAVMNGLLTEDEADAVSPNDQISRELFTTVMGRFSDMNKYLYWEKMDIELGGGKMKVH